ncbi:serine hydrolase domain-containing protein [Tunturiibacter gelidoferens]|uniref:CubicO group peptidase (Beta-lactamase class C family) n=1 Tax=Tunturiibacter gelidiferens TaxID=3069689 RepID=A0ACC5P1D7_9BACT|nr:serine hydrolase domain-containing protein [Edaphobacter lichenicola]MBB5340618.1 CubicO group peptidase (beta-lactamase class C family) [Edaphobacter lichenicola]
MRSSTLAAVAVLLCVPPLFSQADHAPASQTSPPQSIAAEIHAVETGLLPPVTVSGDPHPTRSLTEEMRRRHVPAVSIAVIHNGTIRWAHAWGTLNPAGGPPATPDTLFQAASISKSLTAQAALHLVQQGKLSLDAPVQTELKGWTLPQNNFTAQHPVTLRELLSHTAGVNVHGFPGYATAAPVPTLQQVLDGIKPANTEAIRVTAVPGQANSYSGGGFTIVQQMMIDTTSQPFPQIMQSLVLGPIGMHHSTYQQPLPQSRLKEVALPADDKGEPIPGGPHIYPEMAAAGLWTTPSDLALWIIEMQRSLSGHANHVLSPDMTRTMLTPIKDNYGLGVDLSRQNDIPSFAHSGGNAGYKDFYIGYENGDGAVIMTSSDSGGWLWPDILRSISRVYNWSTWKTTQRGTISLAPSALTPYTGKFSTKSLGEIEIALESGHLQANLSYHGSSPLFPSAPNTFFATDTQIELRFDSPDSGTFLVDNQSIPFTRAK